MVMMEQSAAISPINAPFQFSYSPPSPHHSSPMMDLATLIIGCLLRICLSLLRWFNLEIILSGMTLLMEAIQASLEQTSPNKLDVALYGLIIAAVSLFYAFGLLASKYYNRHNKSTVRNQGRHKPGHHLGWGFAETLGLISSMLTLISASLHYHYLRNAKQQPIRFSMFPLAFSVCVFCSCFFLRPSDRCRFHLVVGHGENRPFACSVCGHSLHTLCYYV